MVRATSLGFAAALALGALASPAQAEDAGFSVAPAGPCAVAPGRDPCAGGACSRQGVRISDRFLPGDVAADAAVADDAPPDLPSFDGPGSCADPSAGCGTPGFSRPGQLASNDAGGSVNPPGTPPPSAPPPIAGGGGPLTPPSPPPPAPPAIPSAPPAPPAPATPPAPAPPIPPVVVEPPPGPALPPGVPTPTP